MNKLDELRDYVSKLFEKATEKETIERVAVVTSKIDEIEADTKASQDEYNKLLKDYKDVVIHSSFKPLNNSDRGADIPNANASNINDIFDAALKNAMEQK